MCGELENLEHEIENKRLELESLERRRDDLQRLIDERKQPRLDMHLDPERRNWEYDGDGRRISRTLS